jgi:hypothetical protein
MPFTSHSHTHTLFFSFPPSTSHSFDRIVSWSDPPATDWTAFLAPVLVHGLSWEIGALAISCFAVSGRFRSRLSAVLGHASIHHPFQIADAQLKPLLDVPCLTNR